jgi:hypothetical protein
MQKPKQPNASRPSTPAEPTAPARLSRRGFLGSTSSVALLATTGLTPMLSACGDEDDVVPGEPPPVDALASLKEREKQVRSVRLAALEYELDLGSAENRDNGDEARYPERVASYSKGLPHDNLGHVDPAAYAALLKAVSSGQHADFESIPLGGQRKLVNPQAAFAFELHGPDSHALALPPAPAFASPEMAGELVELYWMALTRDIPYSEYATHPLIDKACRSLSRLSTFRGPKEGTQVTPTTLFRGGYGDLTGPFISQFLLMDAPFGPQVIRQLNRVDAAGVDHVTTYEHWLQVNNGNIPGRSVFDATARYIYDGRTLGSYVHVDQAFQPYLTALLILQAMRAPSDAADPYRSSATQQGAITFGPAHIGPVLCGAAQKALKVVFYQKWNVHRRLRPETYAGRVHNHVTRRTTYDLHPEVLDSDVLADVFSKHGTYLLSQAFPEGSPIHPSYGSAHSVIAGACVTLLKAVFDENFVIPNPVVPNADGTALVPYTGAPLTVGGELNKLAFNVSLGRCVAGVHFRSEGYDSMRLGEEVAIRILREEKLTLNEPFAGFSLTKFDGTTITL